MYIYIYTHTNIHTCIHTDKREWYEGRLASAGATAVRSGSWYVGACVCDQMEGKGCRCFEDTRTCMYACMYACMVLVH